MNFEEYTPEFNGAIHHAYRVAMLVSAYQAAATETIDTADDFRILDLLDQEIDPYMTAQEVWEAEMLRARAKNSGLFVREYFVFLNRLAHSKGIMQKYEKKGLGVETQDD